MNLRFRPMLNSLEERATPSDVLPPADPGGGTAIPGQTAPPTTTPVTPTNPTQTIPPSDPSLTT